MLCAFPQVIGGSLPAAVGRQYGPRVIFFEALTMVGIVVLALLFVFSRPIAVTVAYLLSVVFGLGDSG
ncbi:hypothetical protein KRM28CT15_03320 [Krasilnikovia sp. M28-CT-15]